MSENEIRKLAEKTFGKMKCPIQYETEHNVGIIADTLRQLSPPVPIGREDLGKMLYNVEAESCSHITTMCDWNDTSKELRELFCVTAETFANSIAGAGNGVCEWSPFTDKRLFWKPSCEANQAALKHDDFRFCPFCSKPIKQTHTP